MKKTIITLAVFTSCVSATFSQEFSDPSRTEAKDNAGLLEKIEELTLLLIEQAKESQDQKTELEGKLEKLQKELITLKNKIK